MNELRYATFVDVLHERIDEFVRFLHCDSGNAGRCYGKELDKVIFKWRIFPVFMT